jgi:hypothetical protein
MVQVMMCGSSDVDVSPVNVVDVQIKSPDTGTEVNYSTDGSPVGSPRIVCGQLQRAYVDLYKSYEQLLLYRVCVEWDSRPNKHDDFYKSLVRGAEWDPLNILMGSFRLLKLVLDSCHTDSCLLNTELADTTSGRLVLCACMSLSIKFASASSLYCMRNELRHPVTLGLLYRAMHIHHPLLSNIEHDDISLHSDIARIEGDILQLLHSRLFDTLFKSSPVCVAELALEGAYEPWTTPPTSLVLIRNLCVFYALTAHFVCESIELINYDIASVCMRLAIESIDLVGGTGGGSVQPSDVPCVLREKSHGADSDVRTAKKLASVVAFDSYVDTSMLPHLKRAQTHSLCGPYLCTAVLENLVDRL